MVVVTAWPNSPVNEMSASVPAHRRLGVARLRCARRTRPVGADLTDDALCCGCDPESYPPQLDRRVPLGGAVQHRSCPTLSLS
jgi:hypothetical protein